MNLELLQKKYKDLLAFTNYSLGAFKEYVEHTRVRTSDFQNALDQMTINFERDFKQTDGSSVLEQESIKLPHVFKCLNDNSNDSIIEIEPTEIIPNFDSKLNNALCDLKNTIEAKDEAVTSKTDTSLDKTDAGLDEDAKKEEIEVEDAQPSKPVLTKSQKARAKKNAKKLKNKTAVIPETPVTNDDQKNDNKNLPSKHKLDEDEVKTTQTEETMPAKKLKPTIEHFRRVKSEDVDPKLLAKMGSNSFNNKKGAAGSFGEKASQDLIKTRGKSFTAEKNKKKRGAYRGGKIDTSNSYSIKYDSSD